MPITFFNGDEKIRHDKDANSLSVFNITSNKGHKGHIDKSDK